MPEIERLVIATQNPAKVEHYRNLFTEIAGNVVGLAEIGIKGKPVETGTTAEENAEIKAKYYSGKTVLPVFCEDEALIVDFLSQDSQPGTHVRRINGKDEATDDELFTYWENIIKNVPMENRTGRWHIAYSLALNGLIRTVSINHEVLFFYPTSKFEYLAGQ